MRLPLSPRSIVGVLSQALLGFFITAHHLCAFLMRFFFCCSVATQLTRQLQQEISQLVSSSKEAQKRLSQRHSVMDLLIGALSVWRQNIQKIKSFVSEYMTMLMR